MAKKKILNDPVYGFISIPYGIIFNLMDHPFVQRLRRIKQTSLTHYVYPGALHTRFHHALGALHLMTQAIDTLRSKGVEITEPEAEAVSIAILLHDIGHGPFSHTLENTLINVSHEQLSEMFMERLNEEFEGALSLAITIFKDDYKKKFLHQLVSSQLDMDRMDYLNRDSFFTGVYEGVIGYDRIIKMLAVHQGELVVEEKGIYSVEKFLIARRLMYWQVYLHKTVLSAEQMLICIFERARNLLLSGEDLPCPPNLRFFISHKFNGENLKQYRDELLTHFALLDDFDVIFAVKSWMNATDPMLSFLSKGLINRHLFRLEFNISPFSQKYISSIEDRLIKWWPGPPAEALQMLIKGQETNSAYSNSKEEIKILLKTGKVVPMSLSSEYRIESKLITKYFLCYPKKI